MGCSEAMNSTASLRRISAEWSAHRKTETDPERVVFAGVLLTSVCVVTQALTQLLDFGLGLHIGAFESDVHTSIFGILSLVAQGSVAVAAASRSARSARRKAWLVLSALVLVLLVVRISIPYHAILLLPFVAAVFFLVVWLTAHDPPRWRAIVWGSLFLLVFSFVVHAVGVKVVTALGYGTDSWPYEIKALLKHTAELAGWLLLMTGIVASAGLPGARSAGTMRVSE